jgi:hypothetical protein
MLPAAAALESRGINLPIVSFGPFRLLEAVPWLMLASALRFVGYANQAIFLPALIVASVAIFLAFILAARRMVEFTGGHTHLAGLSFNEQLLLSRAILWRIGILLVAGTAFAFLAGAGEVAPAFLLGFDGIAFDQFVRLGLLWSAVLAAIMLLMIFRVQETGTISLRDALQQFWLRAAWLLPAIAALFLALLLLNIVQHWGRTAVYTFWTTTNWPQNVKNLVYFFFVFGFATLRLWLVLAVLIFAIRESYWQGQRQNG